MTSIEYITIEADDAEAAHRFYATAFGLDGQVRVRESKAPTTGFRWFTVSLIMSQPSDVKALVDAALDNGAESLKPAEKSFWGFGGVVKAPDGTIWSITSSSKKDTGPVSREFSDIVLLLGTTDMNATKQCYVDHGLTVAKSFGRKYTEFESGSGAVKVALYGRRSLAKTAGVAPEGSGSHRLVIGGDTESFTDPDEFVWETASRSAIGGESVEGAAG